MGASLASGSVSADLELQQAWTVRMGLDLDSVGAGLELEVVSADLEPGACWCWGELGSYLFGMQAGDWVCGSWPGTGADCKPRTTGSVCSLGLEVPFWKLGPRVWSDAGAEWELGVMGAGIGAGSTGASLTPS